MNDSSNFNDNRQSGYISLYRSIQNHWLYPSGRSFTDYEAWTDLLMQANHKPRAVRVKNKVIHCERGQSVRSITQWAERWKWTRSKVYRFLEILKADGMIETHSETVTTRITICNYESYQTPVKKDETDSETNLKRGRNAPETRADTNNNGNNVNKGINIKTNTRARGEVSSSGYSPEQVPLPATVEEVINIGQMKGIPVENCELYFDLRGRDNFLRNTKQGWAPIMNWHKDLFFLYEKGALNKDTKQSKHGENYGTGQKSKGDQHVEALRGILS